MTLKTLKAEIEKLDPRSFNELRFWMNTLDDDEWDRQIRADAEAGKLDFLAEQARKEHRAGKTLPWPGEHGDDEAEVA